MTKFSRHLECMPSDRLLYSLKHLPEHLLKAQQFGEAQTRAGEGSLARATFITARQKIERDSRRAVREVGPTAQEVEILSSMAHSQARAKQTDDPRETFAYAVGLANQIKDDMW